MPRLKYAVPRYRLHRASGQAVVKLDGRERYLGKHGTPESRREYDRLIAEWTAAGRMLPAAPPGGPTVDEVILAYWRFAERHYVRDGAPTRELANIKDAIRPLRKIYGATEAAKFKPSSMETIQRAMIDVGLCRSTINYRASKIRRLFAWAVRSEMVPPSVLHGLGSVPGLRRGRDGVREGGKVRPVPAETLEKIAPFLPATVRGMVAVQAASGMRPGEVVTMRASSIDRSGPVWVYRPSRHKTEDHGIDRAIFLGPRAQAALGPFLEAAEGRGGDPHLFSPRDSAEAALAARRNPDGPARPNRKRKSKPKRAPGGHYSRVAYGTAIRRACVAAGVDPFGPNRIRHTVATAVRERYGLEAAQVILGHAKAETSQLYAEKNMRLAREVMGEVG